EFGDEASILSSQKTASGVEVIAALEYDEALLPGADDLIETSRLSEQEYDSDFGVDVYANQQIRSNQQRNANQSNLGTNNSSVLEAKQVTNSLADDAKANQQSSSIKPKRKNIGHLQWATDPGLTAMKEELGLMRSMMSEQLKGIGWNRYSEKEPTKAMLTRRFVGMGISPQILSQLMPLVKPQQDFECSWQNLLALLAKSLKMNSQNILSQGGIYAFMGPTGSGKSTAIAKIAARFVIRHGAQSVALISTDNYRLSAQQQLSGFAKLLGVSVANVSRNRSMNDLLEHFKSKKLILIDTAGPSKNDQAIIKQLDLLKENSNIKRLLMMPATNQTAVLRHSVSFFRRYSPYSVIITKLDEAASLGEVLSIILENNLPVAFTTDGQRIPEDIRVAKNHQLVSKAVWLTNKYGQNPEDWQLAQEQQAIYA
ncbi:MAG: flagellar biosynthesis protein FlhF, partial [Kangiellaceae bacterium]|nr:flagellar biosynthesis protein FlhF [Kangiellaceae bacterium]